MILLNSALHARFKEAVATAEGDEGAQWYALMDEPKSVVSDGLLALLEYGIESPVLTKAFPKDKLNDRLLHIQEWYEGVQDPTADGGTDTGSLILYKLWDHTSATLTRLIRESRLNADIPKEGGVLLYLGGLSKCLVIGYKIIGEQRAPRYNIIAVIDNPKSAFDFWGAIDQAGMGARNHLKRVLSTGHKIIVHRGVLVHVDRRSDIDVFGPSIDTLVLSEILAQQVFESGEHEYQTALEIGCGSGFLTAALAKHGRITKELFAIDVNFHAVACTRRNVFNSDVSLNKQDTAQIYFINGTFSPTLLNRRFDLVVCNPPYIPTVPAEKGVFRGQGQDYFQAVGGTDLMKGVITSTPEYLNPGGRLLLMTSSLSLEEAISCIPAGYNLSKPLEMAAEDGFEVIFDVEAVQNKPGWLAYLKMERGLIERNGVYYHRLHPLWIERPAQ